MMSTTQISDPGTGTKSAPVGSVEWALRVRLSMQFLVNHIHSDPESLAQYHTQCIKHRAWTMMHKKDGSTFSSFDEFCETPQPWGLGRKWKELEPYVSAALGKKAVQLATVAPSVQGKRTDVDTSHPEGAKLKNGRQDRLRAILRAPIEVQDLYREGLISQTLAAKLGPKNPAKAKPREEVASTISSVPRDRKAIDDAIRTLLGQRRPSRVEQAVKLVAQMSGAELKRFFEAVEQYR